MLYVPFNASEAVLVKMPALIDIILDAVRYGLVAKEALGRVIGVASLALKRSVRFGVEALAGQGLIAKVAHETRIMIVLIVVQGHLLAALEAAAALFASNIQRVHHF